MENLKIPEKYKKILNDFAKGLKDVYGDGLVSVILYGSAASGEFIDKYSNLNLLVVLDNTNLLNLKKSSGLIRKFRMIKALFLTKDYIASSTDVFPIEFLDMQENYFVIYGNDALKDIHIDTGNLRFQCEQELKGKLIRLKQGYLAIHDDKNEVLKLLFSSFTSILHILRNALRIKGRKPSYLKQEVIKEIALEFNVEKNVLEKILAAKNKQIRLDEQSAENLCIDFVKEVESIANTLDKL